MAIFRVLWQAMTHFNLRGYQYIQANLAFVVLSLPIVTIPAAWSALIRYSHLCHSSPHTDLSDLWDAFKENFWRGLFIGCISVVIVALNLFNLYQYRFETGFVVWFLRSIWLASLLVWFSIQLYVWTLFYEMETPSLKSAFVNALIMLMRHPLFTVGLVLVVLALSIISTIFTVSWILLTVSFLACLANAAVFNHLETDAYRSSTSVTSTPL